MLHVGQEEIDFLNKWQTLIGSAFGPFLAIMLSMTGFWIDSKRTAVKERKETLRRISIGTARSINGLFTTREQIRNIIVMINTLISTIETCTDNHTYVFDSVNFPITGEIYRDIDAGLLRVESFYLLNKLLFIDSGLKDFNKIIQNLKEDLSTLIQKNEMLVALKDEPIRQRRSYVQNLKHFSKMLEHYAENALPDMIRLLMQASIYNEFLRKRYMRTLWKYEGFWFKYFKTKENYRDSDRIFDSIKEIDQIIEKSVSNEIRKAEVRKGFSN